MQFRAEEYYEACLRRMRQAFELHKGKNNSALTIYCGGLAVECILRAFRWTKNASFEGRHDLAELFKASGLVAVEEAFMRGQGRTDDKIRESGEALNRAMNEVIELWHNNLRFASEKSLKAFLRRLHRLHGIKGNPLRKNAQELLVAAQIVVTRGVVLWASKRKSRGH